MRTLRVGWLLEEWRRKGIEVTVVEGIKLEITGDSELHIDQISPLIREYKREILAYLADEGRGRSIEDRQNDLPRDPIPSVCKSCPRLELVDREDEVMAGCLYESPIDTFRFGWKRLSADITVCMWTRL